MKQSDSQLLLFTRWCCLFIIFANRLDPDICHLLIVIANNLDPDQTLQRPAGAQWLSW